MVLINNWLGILQKIAQRLFNAPNLLQLSSEHGYTTLGMTATVTTTAVQTDAQYSAFSSNTGIQLPLLRTQPRQRIQREEGI